VAGGRGPEGALFDARAAREDREVVEVLLERAGVRVERILSRGQATPAGQWYDQPRDEWVGLLAGRATLEYADGTRVGMRAGDWLLIPARVRHRVAMTSRRPPCVWLAVFLPPGG
jgi:cupin 2 domain-containing protein